MYTVVQKDSAVNAVSIEAQGSLLAIAARSNVATAPVGGLRGNVTDFSAASRRRMLRKLARLQPDKITFVTLTYPDVMTDDRQAYNDLRTLFERIRYRWPKSSAIWRKEYQGRGSIHFHLLCFNMPWWPFQTLRAEWANIIGHHFPAPLFVRIEKIRSKKGAMFYVSKYMAKQRGPEKQGGVAQDPALLDYVAYPQTGRHWGIFNRHALPYAPKQYLTIRIATWRTFHDVKRLFRRQWRRINNDRWKGGVIFSERAYGLWAASLRLLLNDIHDEWYASDLIRIGA